MVVHNSEILSEWDQFAHDISPMGSDMSIHALRDHVQQLLTAIAKNVDIAKGEKKRIIKSKGHLPMQEDIGVAAHIHGMLRHHDGFHLKEISAEFQALRASVLRLWLPSVKSMTQEFIYEVIRFNEAIDVALIESINTFSDQTARTRDSFLGVLGHDLRNPLNVIAMNGAYLQKAEGSDSIHTAGLRIVVSSARMSLMINDLLEYGRTQLGGHMALRCHEVDIQRVCQAIVDEARATHPTQEFLLKVSGDLIGSFDEARLQQVFSNLLCNAARYSKPGLPIEISAKGLTNAITVKVHNVGPVVPEKWLQAIFEPLIQLSQQAEPPESSSHSVGLGLYIAREITQAHGGTIHATSSKRSGTTFTVQLPRTHGGEHEPHPVPHARSCQRKSAAPN